MVSGRLWIDCRHCKIACDSAVKMVDEFLWRYEEEEIRLSIEKAKATLLPILEPSVKQHTGSMNLLIISCR